MKRTILYVATSATLYMTSLCASDQIEGHDACSQLSKQVGQFERTELPEVLRQFVYHEGTPGISNNVILQLTPAQFSLYCKILRGLSYVSIIITYEKPSSDQATQGSQASEVSTVLVYSSQDDEDSQGSLSQTQPFKPTS